MPDEQQPSSGYAFGQLERALRMAAGHDDPAVRERALAKAERWRAVIGGMAGGELTVGSRTPVAGTPAWVTLEVAHGGFATGRLLAELPLSDDETARVAGLPAEAPGTTDGTGSTSGTSATPVRPSCWTRWRPSGIASSCPRTPRCPPSPGCSGTAGTRRRWTSSRSCARGCTACASRRR